MLCFVSRRKVAVLPCQVNILGENLCQEWIFFLKNSYNTVITTQSFIIHVTKLGFTGKTKDGLETATLDESLFIQINYALIMQLLLFAFRWPAFCRALSIKKILEMESLFRRFLTQEPITSRTLYIVYCINVMPHTS